MDISQTIESIIINKPETGSFLVDVIAWLVKITSSVALGVILFTVILKLITLVPDFISRKSMRKNSLKMEEMRPELEKLQKQYADNKDLYNQKMMALYKKNGYSMFGACIPTIVTLVIFFVAIAAFNNYSNYQNVMYYYDMSVSYNQVIYDGIYKDNDIIKMENHQLVVDDKRAIEENGKLLSDDITLTVEVLENEYHLSTGSYIIYIRSFDIVNGEKIFTQVRYAIDSAKLAEAKLEYNGEKYSYSEGDAVTFLKGVCADNAAYTFKHNGSKMGWIKNIWQPDTTTAHPVTDAVFSTNKSSCNCGSCNKTYGEDIDDEVFNNLTAGLEDLKDAPNGYYILVILTALSSLAMQLITSKSQKAQMDLQTVNGQGAQQQKMMMWMMPIMMAFFSFMYTAAFSIYIILSSIISILTTLGINAIVDKQYKKQNTTKNVVTRSRIYTPKEQPKAQQEQPKKKKKDDIPEIDFLRASAEKKGKHKRK